MLIEVQHTGTGIERGMRKHEVTERLEWLRFSLFDLYGFQIFDFSSDTPEVVAKVIFNPQGFFFSYR